TFFTVSLADISDMPAFVSALRAANESNASPAAKRIWNELSAEVRSKLAALDFSRKSELDKQLKATDAELRQLMTQYSKNVEIRTVPQLAKAAGDDPTVSKKIQQLNELTAKLNEMNSAESQ